MTPNFARAAFQLSIAGRPLAAQVVTKFGTEMDSPPPPIDILHTTPEQLEWRPERAEEEA